MISHHPSHWHRRNYILPFSLFQVLFRAYVIANLGLSVLIIVDFFLPSVEKIFYFDSIIGRRDEFLVYEKGNFDNWRYVTIFQGEKKIAENDSIKLYFTPVFDLKKSYVFRAKTGEILKRQELEIGLPFLVIFANILGFLLFVLYPQRLDTKEREYKQDVDFVVSIFFAPTFASVIYWIKLYHFLSRVL